MAFALGSLVRPRRAEVDALALRRKDLDSSHVLDGLSDHEVTVTDWRSIGSSVDGAFSKRGRVVITDRLHGHILCLLARIPHVIVDSRFGKVRAFHDAWTTDSSLVLRADSAAMAVELARDLVRRQGRHVGMPLEAS